MTAAVDHKMLQQLEEDIQEGLDGIEVEKNKIAMAVVEIRDEKHYEKPYGTLKNYAEQRWGWSEATLYNYLERGRFLKENSNMLEFDVPIRQLRVLSDAPPEWRREIWDQAVADGDTSPEHLKELIDARRAGEEGSAGADDDGPGDRRGGTRGNVKLCRKKLGQLTELLLEKTADVPPDAADEARQHIDGLCAVLDRIEAAAVD